MKNFILSSWTLTCFLLFFANVTTVHAQQGGSPCLSANVFILLDKSKSMIEHGSLECSFSEAIFSNLPVNNDQVWFGSGIFGQTFFASPFTSSVVKAEEQLNELCQRVALGEMTKLDDELLYFQTFFAAVESERGRKVPNILIIVSDGEFTDNDATIQNGKVLRQGGIQIFTIRLRFSPVGATHLQDLASGSSYFADNEVASIIKKILNMGQCP